MDTELMFSSKSDEWATPQYFYDTLNKEFNFTLDPCANSNNYKCLKYYTIQQDGLKQSWENEIVFCNPPYSKIKHWVKKAHDEVFNNATTILLIPARTNTKYFHEFIWDCEKHKVRENISEIRFIKGRLKFGESNNSAPFPSMLVIFKLNN